MKTQLTTIFTNLRFGRLARLGLCFLVLSASAALANEDETSRPLGEVRMFGETFATMRDYVESDAFRTHGGRCGFDMTEPRVRSHSGARLTTPPANAVGDCTSSLTRIQSKYDLSRGLVINIWFHIIQNTSGAGAVSNAEIEAQMTALNEDFLARSGTQGEDGHPTRIRFNLAGVTRTTNDFWYADSPRAELEYKAALGRDQDQFLNVYTNSASGFLGYAYFPTGGAAGSTFDGVTLMSETVGGRNNDFPDFDQGRTLTHEIGHYLGLEHTFGRQNTCANTFSAGDLITDTPAEIAPYNNRDDNCPSSNTDFPNSCGVQRAVANYMNYNRDSCMDNFTAQQSNRMVCSLLTYRPMLGDAIGGGGLITPVYNLLFDEDDD